jgi:hypothetical protein
MHPGHLLRVRSARWLGTLAVACSILCISYSVLPSATNDGCGPSPPTISLILPDGATLAVSASTARLEAFAHERRSALDGALARVEALGREAFAAGMSAPFASAYGHLPAFAEWAYSWIGNYIFSYQVMFAAGRAGGTSVLTGGPLVPAAKEAVTAAVAREFDARVLAPARLHQSIETSLVDARTLVREELERFFRSERAAWERLAAASCRPAGEAAGDATRRVAVAGSFIPVDREPVAEQVTVSDEVTGVFAVRAVRPFGVRLAIPTLAALGIGGASGFGAGLALSAGLVWSLDYVINSIDATMNRTRLELLLVSQVRAEELRLTTTMGRMLRAGLDAGTAGYRDGLVALASISGIARGTGRESPIVSPTGP